MKRQCLFAAVMAIAFAAGAQSTYTVASIPETLKKNANVVTHVEQTVVTVDEMEKVVQKVRKVFTVLNADGKDALVFQQYTNRSMTLEEAEIKLYDAFGRQTARVKKKEMSTQAVGEGLVEDGYVTYYTVDATTYPVTVEFNYELRLASTLWFPHFRYGHFGEAVIESNYTATVPSDLPLRHKDNRGKLTPTVTEEGKNKIYRWTVQQQPAIAYEAGGAATGRLPQVNIVPERFSHHGLPGDFSSWNAFGRWIGALYQGLDDLAPDRQAFFQQLVAGATTDTEKMRRIYQYLQQNFRYVSIQLGLGGYRPFSASFTDQKKYGDCKALSNYMKAALKAVGIQSHVAIINAGHNGTAADVGFPENMFNHVILCVPGKADSTWLECTSNTAAFGVLGTFTENRNALLVTATGGTLVPTPASRAASNRLVTQNTVKLEPTLSASIESVMAGTGKYGEMMDAVLKEKHDEQKETVVNYFGYKQPDDFAFAAVNGQTGQSNLRLSVRKLSEFNAGNKHFLRPRANRLWTARLPAAAERQEDFYFPFPFERHDTTVFRLTPGMQPDALPVAKELKTPHTVYRSACWYNAGEHAVYTATTLVLQRHRIPAADYKTVKAFFDEVLLDDNQRIVLKKDDAAPESKKAF